MRGASTSTPANLVVQPMKTRDVIGRTHTRVAAGARIGRPTLLLSIMCAATPTPTLACGAPSSAVAVSAGHRHTCALYEEGTATCWGSAESGQLGRGTETPIGDNETPAEHPHRIDVGIPIVQISAGQSGTCALLSDGRVLCWGDGVLLPGTDYARAGFNVGDNELVTLDHVVDVGGTAIALAGSGSHVCSILESGSVRCWGGGADAARGYPDDSPAANAETPADAGDLVIAGRAQQIAAGAGHTCVLLDGGGVRCWGANFHGQLGYGHTDDIGDDESPASAGEVDAGGPVAQVFVGVTHTCALLTDGTVRCWGDSSGGQLGYALPFGEDVGDDELPSALPALRLSEPVKQLALGQWHTCALLESGKVTCWGEGVDGQLGTMMSFVDQPEVFGSTQLSGRAVQITANHEHTCALLDGGDVQCWGSGLQGRLGYGNIEDVGDDEVPADVGPVPLYY